MDSVACGWLRCMHIQMPLVFDVNGVFTMHITQVSLQNNSRQSLLHGDVVWSLVCRESEADHLLPNGDFITDTSYITNGLAE